MWGAFFGGMAGFMTGGPLGALFGASVGRIFWDKRPLPHVLDPFGVLRSAEVSFSRIRAEAADVTLSTALVFLAGHLAAAGRKDIDNAEQTLRIFLEPLHPIHRTFGPSFSKVTARQIFHIIFSAT